MCRHLQANCIKPHILLHVVQTSAKGVTSSNGVGKTCTFCGDGISLVVTAMIDTVLEVGQDMYGLR